MLSTSEELHLEEIKLWPSLDEAHGTERNLGEEDGWEVLSLDDSMVVVESVVLNNPSSPRMPSVENSVDTSRIEILSSHEDDEILSHVVIASEEATFSPSGSHVMVSPIPLSSGSIRRVTSFKDAILLEFESGKENLEQKESFILKPRQKNKPKLVVSPIRRCSKSTGDLKSLVIEEEHEEVLAATDVMDYYHRKNKGWLNRKNGRKIRPDELKRKEMIIQKKEIQRQQQQDREKERKK